ncbi:17-beta-hydroxysteroid dehydrogenase 13-like isoform X2 [Daktulosphaira vitifoliae]|uniref:17-beta-hydroxysteroid dehydrogenase 13-like isoform X2 n=1 Tax=Daktulosphaira vitifoliae TaxID=58002 RepID=UPI0021A98EB3|nr:17-beta-hydroxysteroid dehydrogenase 13-like isoform X2 [Daktulosphaira vitifoliae]
MASIKSNGKATTTISSNSDKLNNIFNYVILGTKIVFGIVYTVYTYLQLLLTTFYCAEKTLRNKIILVTGAGRGLGREISLQLSREGARVICVDINTEGVKETCEMIKNEQNIDDLHTEYYTTNVADPVQVKELAKTVENKWGRVDILINNAGIVASTPLLEVTDDSLRRMVDVNLVSQFWMVRAFLPNMLRINSGHIVATSSIAAFSCAANIAPYTATKYGVTGFMSCLGEELRANPNNKILTTTIHPFFLDSEPIKVKHWDVKSVLPSLSIPEVATAAIRGIKKNHVVVSIPEVLKFSMSFLWLMPQAAQNYWRDIFKAEIDTV